MRVAHIGNIAQNAYLNAKLQRRVALLFPDRYGDVEVDSYDTGGGPPMRVPYWEDGQFAPPAMMQEHWFDWISVPMQNGYQRPPWAKIQGNHLGSAAWYDTQEAYEADAKRHLLYHVHPDLGRSHPARATALRAALAASRLTPEEQALCFEPLLDEPPWTCIREIARHYDLVVLYGPWARFGCILPRAQRWIAFEHSTLRYVPWLRQAGDVLLACAYGHADHVLVTNADCQRSARLLELERVSWIPHPVDELAYVPADPGNPAPALAMRAHLGVAPEDFLCFAPARLDLHLKGTATLLYGVARYVRDAEPRGAPRATLLLIGGGDDHAAALNLAQVLGLGERLCVMQAQPKWRLRALYHAADVVLDQFSPEVGSYGTTTVEAMACGKPLITWVDARVHAGVAACPDKAVCLALEAHEIAGWLERLARDPGLRAAKGAEGQAWVEAHHGWQATAEASIAVYRRVLARAAREESAREESAYAA